MAGLIFDKAQIEQTIDAVVARTMRMDMTWDWPCGVAYYGICEAYEVTGKQEYLKLVQDRVDEYIELGLPEWTVNTCSMGHCLITLYEHTGDERYLNIAKSKVDYLENKALRFGDRVLQHTVSVNNDFPEQAWADTLFMAAFFLLRMGVLLKDAALIDDALNQYYWHIKYLQDPATGLYYHGYNNLTGDHMSGIFWGRANAWAAYTMSQVGLLPLSQIPRRGGQPQRPAGRPQAAPDRKRPVAHHRGRPRILRGDQRLGGHCGGHDRQGQPAAHQVYQ